MWSGKREGGGASWLERMAGVLVGDEEEDSSERAAAGTATEQPEVDMDVDGAAVGPMDAAVGSASDLADELGAGFKTFMRMGTSWLEAANTTLFADKHREALATPLSRRIRVVGVMGSGEHTHERLARPLGAWIAHAGFHLLTGGAGASMAAVASAFTEVQPRRGLSIGVLPCISADDHLPKAGCPNDYVELPICTHLHLLGSEDPLCRNSINILSSDVVVALPGGAGTRSEIALALRYGKPVCVFESKGDLGTLGMHVENVPAFTSLDDVAAFVRENIAALAASEQEKAKQRAAEHVATVQAAAHVAAQAEARSAVQAAEGTTVADAATSPLHEQPHVADVSMPGDEHAQAAPGGVDGDETEEKKEKEEATGSAGIAAAVAEAVAEVSDVADDTD